MPTAWQDEAHTEHAIQTIQFPWNNSIEKNFVAEPFT